MKAISQFRGGGATFKMHFSVHDSILLCKMKAKILWKTSESYDRDPTKLYYMQAINNKRMCRLQVNKNILYEKVGGI